MVDWLLNRGKELEALEEARKASAEGFRTRVVEEVRQNSKNLGKPTRSDRLAVLGPDLKPEEIESSLAYKTKGSA